MIFDYYILNYLTYIILIPGILLSLWAQIRVKTTFKKYSKVGVAEGKTAYQFARRLLNKNGCQDVRILDVAGELTDHYNPKNKTLSLSTSVMDFESVAAVGVAAHECGHAVQDHKGTTMFKLRSALVPITNIGTFLATPLIIIGIILLYVTTAWQQYANYIILAGLCCYSLSALFCLVTLPVELDASRRAKKMLIETGDITQEELKGVSKVLNAAAMTYVASLFVSLLSLLRLVVIVLSMSGRAKRD